MHPTMILVGAVVGAIFGVARVRVVAGVLVVASAAMGVGIALGGDLGVRGGLAAFAVALANAAVGAIIGGLGRALVLRASSRNRTSGRASDPHV